MEFNLEETQEELRRLAADVLGGQTTPERLAAHERGGAPYDVGAWKALAQAGLFEAFLPAEVGGAGLGAVELAVLLREVASHAAPVPVFASLALAALPIAMHGTAEQRRLLEPLADGEAVLTGAVREPGASGAAALHVTTAARRDNDHYRLDGVKTFVPYAAEASHILVPARVEGAEVGVFLLRPEQLALSPHPASTGEPVYRAGLDRVRVEVDALLGGTADGTAWRTLHSYAVAGAVAGVCGALEAALRLTTEYVKTREQFGRPLARFQAVTMQVGDVYIAKRALDVAMWGAVWRLAERREDATEVLAIAAYTACEAALAAFYTCQHLHGGIGLDVTYPLHRHFARGKHYAHLLGGAEAQLDAIGALVA